MSCCSVYNVCAATFYFWWYKGNHTHTQSNKYTQWQNIRFILLTRIFLCTGGLHQLYLLKSLDNILITAGGFGHKNGAKALKFVFLADAHEKWFLCRGVGIVCIQLSHCCKHSFPVLCHYLMAVSLLCLWCWINNLTSSCFYGVFIYSSSSLLGVSILLSAVVLHNALCIRMHFLTLYIMCITLWISHWGPSGRRFITPATCMASVFRISSRCWSLFQMLAICFLPGLIINMKYFIINS